MKNTDIFFLCSSGDDNIDSRFGVFEIYLYFRSLLNRNLKSIVRMENGRHTSGFQFPLTD